LQLKAKDARMKAAEEALQIMKFIKVNALEKFFFKKVNRQREEELKYIKISNLCYVAIIFIYWLCPPTIVSCTFLAYIALGN
jgi:ATP-binding cassette subfamily C (CFTR/MRP) protein 1